MCDFREPEEFFEQENISLEKRKYNGVVHLTQLNRDGTSNEVPLEEGYYLVATTGSFYAYCDGDKLVNHVYFNNETII